MPKKLATFSQFQKSSEIPKKLKIINDLSKKLSIFPKNVPIPKSPKIKNKKAQKFQKLEKICLKDLSKIMSIFSQFQKSPEIPKKSV